MALVLGDVLRQPDFNLELVVGSQEHLKRPVAGAHAVEVPNPTRWLDTEWVLLTTGIRLRGDAAAQRELVEEAAWRGLTAIGFALEVIYRKPPPAMLDEAARRMPRILRGLIAWGNRSWRMSPIISGFDSSRLCGLPGRDDRQERVVQRRRSNIREQGHSID